MQDKSFIYLALAIGGFLFLKSKRQRMLPRSRAEEPEKVTPQGWVAYREKLAQKESAGKYTARRPNSQYWGRYQLGRLARSVTDAKNKTWDEYRQNPGLQDKAVKQWTTRLLRELQRQPDAQKAVADGKATWAQLVAMDHLTGRAAVMKWIRTGEITRDGNRVSNLDWGKEFAGFNLDELKGKTS